MDFLHTIAMGFMQGLTEFLPVSSSGHLVLTSAIYKLITGQDFSVASDEEVLLDIMLHLGTLIAILIYFRKEIWSMLVSFFVGIKTRRFDNYKTMLPIYIIVGTFFTCVVVLLIKDYCEALLTKPNFIGLLLVCTGLILFVSEILSKKYQEKEGKVDIKKAILIGIAQGFAAIPGISRSGTTIATALATGMDRQNAARYSFLLSIPVILLAVLYGIPDIARPEAFVNISWLPILAGTVTATIVGYFCIKYFIEYLKKFSLNIFAYYCILIGLVAFFYFS